MRLWSIQPRFLDRMGLLGLWREALQAQRILIGGPPYKVPYGNHPQLRRFKNQKEPVRAIGYYLKQVYNEGRNRGYNFNRELIKFRPHWIPRIPVSRGQIDYEMRLLLHKLKTRDREKWLAIHDEVGRFEKLGWYDNFQISLMGYPFTLEVDNLDTEPWEKVIEGI